MLAPGLKDASEDELLAAVAKLGPPPPTVAQNILADPETPLPLLERVVEVPVLAPSLKVHEKPGYDRASKCFYRPAEGLEVPRVPDRPTNEDVAEPRRLIVDELLADFPFVGENRNEAGELLPNPERAHAVAFMLEPFVRVLIDGSTPMYLFEAPTFGTGKTLLAQCLATPTLGARKLALMAEARDEDEWRKRLTAKLRTAPAYLVIDNVRRALDSGPLAMMLTAGVVEDRLLGVSEMVTMPVRCTIAATANNATLSDEMARRVVRCRLDANLEAPEDRTEFRHELALWAVEHRGELVWAVLTLVRAWVAEGCPTGPERPLGSFESWTKVLGGILKVAGIPGLLTNMSDVRAHTRDTDHAELLHALYDESQGNEFVAADMASVARLVLRTRDDASDQSASSKLGYRLRQIVDRPMAGLVLRHGPEAHGTGRKWVVQKTGSGSSGASACDGAERQSPPGFSALATLRSPGERSTPRAPPRGRIGVVAGRRRRPSGRRARPHARTPSTATRRASRRASKRAHLGSGASLLPVKGSEAA
jgi:putative DNA primase/helicase